MSSHNNKVLESVRECARLLKMPQSVVSANWTRGGVMTRPYSPTRNHGITRSDYKKATVIVKRLANAANAN